MTETKPIIEVPKSAIKMSTVVISEDQYLMHKFVFVAFLTNQLS